MENLRDLLSTVAPTRSNILITGESGTGKELVASDLHQLSPRREAPYIKINCAAVPPGLLESELFGYEKGAFTGAVARGKGKFEISDGGTLLLDEISEMDLSLQPKLLRAIQEKEFYRVGDTSPTRVDVRVLAATNADLQKEMEGGTFREDLYYRLAVVRLKLPPLRERRTDIPLLAAHFIEGLNRRFGTEVKGFTPEACKVMIGYDWPGNIRELKNVIEATLALESSSLIGIEGLARLMDVEKFREGKFKMSELKTYGEALSSFEEEYFGNLLQQEGNNVELAAAKAEVNIATLYRKIKKYRLR